jgi:hypothetical protein
MASCPKLEALQLPSCSALSYVLLQSASLASLDLRRCDKLTKVRVHACWALGAKLSRLGRRRALRQQLAAALVEPRCAPRPPAGAAALPQAADAAHHQLPAPGDAYGLERRAA